MSRGTPLLICVSFDTKVPEMETYGINSIVYTRRLQASARKCYTEVLQRCICQNTQRVNNDNNNVSVFFFFFFTHLSHASHILDAV